MHACVKKVDTPTYIQANLPMRIRLVCYVILRWNLPCCAVLRRVVQFEAALAKLCLCRCLHVSSTSAHRSEGKSVVSWSAP